MAKWVIIGCAVAAAVAAYLFWSRRSDGMVGRLESVMSEARDQASDAVERASDVAGDAASKAGEQLDRARAAIGAASHSSSRTPTLS
jgi:hypothetical protein